jgi:hypothetical protein
VYDLEVRQAIRGALAVARKEFESTDVAAGSRSIDNFLKVVNATSHDSGGGRTARIA